MLSSIYLVFQHLSCLFLAYILSFSRFHAIDFMLNCHFSIANFAIDLLPIAIFAIDSTFHLSFFNREFRDRLAPNRDFRDRNHIPLSFFNRDFREECSELLRLGVGMEYSSNADTLSFTSPAGGRNLR